MQTDLGQYINPILALSFIGGILGVSLGFAAKKLAVKTDDRVEKVLAQLPGSNCGACGEAGCSAFAEAVVLGKVSTSGCIPGGENTAKAVAKVMGVDDSGTAAAKNIAVVNCGGTDKIVKDKFAYSGPADCVSASLVWGGHKDCSYGCLGLGTCVSACPFGALSIVDGLAVVDEVKCTGCGKCVKACPRKIIKLIPESTPVYLKCSSADKGKSVRDACSVGCIACTLCVKLTPSKVVKMNGNLPDIPSQWDDFEVAVGKCPPKCLNVRKPKAGEENEEN